MDWNIQTRSDHCQVCEKAFQDKKAYHTILREEADGYVRTDVCQPCWKQDYVHRVADDPNYVSYWQGIFTIPPPPPPEPIRKENAESLFFKLAEQQDAQYASALFILAAMLERKRVLKVKTQFHKDQRRFFVYEDPKSGNIYTIADPELQLNQLESVQRQVSFLLEHGIPSASEQPEAEESQAAAPEEPAGRTSNVGEEQAEDQQPSPFSTGT